MSEERTDMVIDLKDVDVFQKDTAILHQVNLQIKQGEFVYLIGRTGSGKSSLLKTLYGELPLQVGSGSINGYDLTKLKKRKVPYLRRSIGIVFQDFQLLTDRNVLQNLLFVLKATGWKDKDKMKQRALEVLEHVGLETKDYKMPHELSGGEQQRVAVARALLNRPSLILADEPTGNLDPEVSDGIMKLLKNISNEGTSVFMATHDYRLINKFFGKIYKCEGGKVMQTTSLN